MRSISQYILVLHLLLLSVLLAACTAVERDIVGLGAAEIEIDQVSAVRRIFVATTRQKSDDPAEFFDGNRAHTMHLGYMDISIPKNHRPGEIERPRNSNVDPAKHFVISEPRLVQNSEAFQGAVDTALLERPETERDVLVFVHGYNTNFSAAALRIAQFVHDTGYKGVPVLFSWASRGKTIDYIYDLNSALQSRNELERLGVILSGVKVNNFDVVAHSMGNLATLEAMRNLENRTDIDSTGRLRSVILASPDVDFDLFKSQLKDFGESKRLFTVLVSEDDKALRLSRRLAGGVSRVGATDPVKLAELGLNVIDLSEIHDRSSTHHSKFASSPEIVRLIGRGIQSGNTLSTQSDLSSLETVVGDVFRGVTLVPSANAGNSRSTVLTVGN